jgi:hypothetical protein
VNDRVSGQVVLHEPNYTVRFLSRDMEYMMSLNDPKWKDLGWYELI